ncbi:MAG: MerR family transcriptional regulator [Pseudomonadota bacterium]
MSKSANAFRTISEVAEWLDTPAHVLRFWESKFSQVKPVKRAGGRRYYRPQDMMLLGGIKKLLHDDGMTIKHVQKMLRQEGVKHVASLSSNPADGLGYEPTDEPFAAEPEPETSQVVSFRTSAEPPEPAPEPDPAPAPETKSIPTPSTPSSEGSMPVPSFLSGGRDMPQPEPTVEAEPQPAAEVAEDRPALPPVEEPPAPEPHTDILSNLSGRSSDDIRAREAALRPVMDRIRAQLERIS